MNTVSYFPNGIIQRAAAHQAHRPVPRRSVRQRAEWRDQREACLQGCFPQLGDKVVCLTCWLWEQEVKVFEKELRKAKISP
jgi:hypothetical protein